MTPNSQNSELRMENQNRLLIEEMTTVLLQQSLRQRATIRVMHSHVPKSNYQRLKDQELTLLFQALPDLSQASGIPGYIHPRLTEADLVKPNQLQKQKTPGD